LLEFVWKGWVTEVDTFIGKGSREQSREVRGSKPTHELSLFTGAAKGRAYPPRKRKTSPKKEESNQ